ncbi:cytochrome b/b6 domain-containing protein [Photobacterium alginatilyticum]|uniref:cytochrome b/b6 domain-containing protein n=1 Tax=Photobacterium alginatilyticum TaxID=1775171 RepID=UPI0040690171
MLKINSKTFGMVLLAAMFACHTQAGPAGTDNFGDQARELRAQTADENAQCLSCHASDTINDEWKSERGRTLDLHTDVVGYNDSVHKDQSCLNCHEGANDSAFEEAPHQFKDDVISRSCDSCHNTVFQDINHQLETSHHTKTIVEQFGHQFECQECHNAHTFNFPGRTEDIANSIEQANEPCFACHNDLQGYEKLTDKKLLDQDMAHWFLPEKNKHFSAVRCVDCHSEGEGVKLHTITPVEDAVRDCKLCHNEDSAITTTLYKYSNEQKAFSMLDKGIFDDSTLLEQNADAIAAEKGKADSPYGFMNEKLLDDRYLIGATPIGWVDAIFGIALLVTLSLLAFHARLRKLGQRDKVELVKTSTVMFPVGVRLWHNTNVIVFIILLLTGLSMHFSVVAFEFAQNSHNILGAVLIVLWGLYLIYLVVSGQIKQYLPRPNFVRDSIRQAQFYLKGIFSGDENPAGHEPKKRLNPLQQMGYLSIVFAAFPLLILSGIALFFNELLPKEIIGFDGKTLMVILHVTMSHVMVLFIAAHVYLCTTGTTISEHFMSMITGRLFKVK